MAGRNYCGKLAFATLLAGVVALPVIPAYALELQTLYSFTDGEDGAGPMGKLIYAGGVLYGTAAGGNGGTGAVFAFDLKTQEFAALYDFSGGEDGAQPVAGVVMKKGVLYGSTYLGGAADYPGGFGTLYALKIKSQKLTTLHTFSGTSDGAKPTGSQILYQGTLYGTTSEGGIVGCENNAGCGTIYSLAIKGDEFDTQFAFPADATNGWFPTAGMTRSKQVLYGTTSTGGIIGGELAYGTVFAISSDGLTTLHTFDGVDGADPDGTMVYKKGTLYGTTISGGNGCPGGCGTLFAMNAATGALTTLHIFTGTDGRSPRGGLLLHKGKLYGVTSTGGTGDCEVGCGTIYSYDLKTGTLTSLYSFTGGDDGSNPGAGLILAKGTFYGTTALGGANGFGALFSLKP